MEKARIVKLDDLKGKTKIMITSTNMEIDFSTQLTHIAIYIDDLSTPKYDVETTSLISKNGQFQKTSIEFPISGNKGLVEIRASYNAEKVRVVSHV